MPQPFIWHSRIRFVDTDATARIHYTALFRHLEIAEDEFFRSLGISYSTIQDQAMAFPRVHVEADYSAALVYDDPIQIAVSIEKVGRASITLAFDVKKTETGEHVAKGRFVIACMDTSTGISVPIPAPIRQTLENAR